MSLDQILEMSKEIFEQGIVGFAIALVSISVLTFIAIKAGKRFFASLLKRNRIDETTRRFSFRLFSVFIYTFAALGIVTQIIPLRSTALSLLAGSGIAVLFIGFAAQEAFSNIIAGFFISFFRPFSVGDLINLPGQNISGRVEDINLRHTVVRTFENNRIIIPNATMNKSILENKDFGERKVCNFLILSISYDSDVDKAKSIIVEEALAHPKLLDVRTAEDIQNQVVQVNPVLFALNNSSVDIRVGLWSKDASDGYFMLADLRDSIKKRFEKEGIEIPYPYQNVVIRK
ncbi:MAG: mechanosensitive ion channel protein MscS [Firmicutes bacterium HGW-Firmicutes-20]|nr:MAG: mechanosensitive ion channel protein MscS [Firmicutes bacterium HGW-Firmicutes-20]